jgi:hypothetical protein
MTLSPRDARIVQLVERFKQLSSAHIHELVFAGHASRTPCDRALLRLTQQNYINRIERKMVGGAGGGSGQYVYSLGRRGFFTLHDGGEFRRARAVNYHTLAIADAFVMLRRLERSGALTIDGVSTEPECHVHVGRFDLKPDMHIELTRRDGERLKLWLEVDMGTQSQRVIRDKLERYWQAYKHALSQQWPSFPLTYFVAVDDERAKELRWLLEQGSSEAQTLFRITTGERLASLFDGQAYPQE